VNPPVLPVDFRETDAEGRVSLANQSTRQVLERQGIELVDGLDIRLSVSHCAALTVELIGRQLSLARTLRTTPDAASRTPLACHSIFGRCGRSLEQAHPTGLARARGGVAVPDMGEDGEPPSVVADLRRGGPAEVSTPARIGHGALRVQTQSISLTL
jgi:hypothetical protein